MRELYAQKRDASRGLRESAEFRFKLEAEKVTVNGFLLLMSTAFTSTGARVINIDCFAHVCTSRGHAFSRIYIYICIRGELRRAP